MSDTFDKLPPGVGPDLASGPRSEDLNGDGLVDRQPTEGFWRWLLRCGKSLALWTTDAATAFANGAFSGLRVSGFAGGVVAVASDAPDVAARASNGGVPAASILLYMGVAAFNDFAKTHPLENPFRAKR